MSRPSSFARTSWVGTADEGLAAADVYSGLNQPVINSVTSVTDKPDVAKIETICGGGPCAKKLAALKAAADAKNKPLSPDILKAATDTLPAAVQTALKTAGDLENKLTAAGTTAAANLLNSLTPGGNVLKATATVNGVVKAIKDHKLPDAKTIAGVIGAVTGNASAVGINVPGMNTGLISNLITGAASVGIPGVANTLLNSLPKGQITAIAGAVVPTLIKTGNYDVLGQVASKVVPGIIPSISPKLVKDFSSVFTTSGLQKDFAKREVFSGITDAFNKANPNWAQKLLTTVTGQTESAVNLSEMCYASNDFKSVVLAGAQAAQNDLDKYLAFSIISSGTTVKSEIASSFPGMAPRPTQTLQSTVYTPAMLGYEDEEDDAPPDDLEDTGYI